MRQGTAALRTRWFTVVERDRGHGRSGVVSTLLTRWHAKERGTNQTACGLVTTTWEKLWDVAFPPSRRLHDVCDRCLELTRRPEPPR